MSVVEPDTASARDAAPRNTSATRTPRPLSRHSPVTVRRWTQYGVATRTKPPSSMATVHARRLLRARIAPAVASSASPVMAITASGRAKNPRPSSRPAQPPNDGRASSIARSHEANAA